MLFIKLPSSRILSYELPHHSLAVPVAIMVGNGMGTKNGILFKTAVSLEETGKTQIVALDKTGTITQGEPKVTDMIPVNSRSETELWAIAYTQEKKSEHPLARVRPP